MSAKLASREGVTRRGHFDLQPPPHSFFGQASEAVSAHIFARALRGELSYRIGRFRWSSKVRSVLSCVGTFVARGGNIHCGQMIKQYGGETTRRSARNR